MGGLSAVLAARAWRCGVSAARTRRVEHREGVNSVVDVKAPWFLKNPDAAAVLEWTGRVCRSRGWRYEVWTGGDRTEVSNVRFLSMARRPAVIDRTASAAVAAVARDGMTIDTIRPDHHRSAPAA